MAVAGVAAVFVVVDNHEMGRWWLTTGQEGGSCGSCRLEALQVRAIAGNNGVLPQVYKEARKWQGGIAVRDPSPQRLNDGLEESWET